MSDGGTRRGLDRRRPVRLQVFRILLNLVDVRVARAGHGPNDVTPIDAGRGRGAVLAEVRCPVLLFLDEFFRVKLPFRLFRFLRAVRFYPRHILNHSDVVFAHSVTYCGILLLWRWGALPLGTRVFQVVIFARGMLNAERGRSVDATFAQFLEQSARVVEPCSVRLGPHHRIPTGIVFRLFVVVERLSLENVGDLRHFGPSRRVVLVHVFVFPRASVCYK